MIAQIVPNYVVVVERAVGEFASGLHPDEKAALGHVVEKRHREFASGRDCAHQALARLGAPLTAILPGPNGEPVWPVGYVGSITHCERYCAAAVAHAKHVLSIGIDSEPIARIPDSMLDLIAFEEERRWIDAHQGLQRGILLFSAKESVFKAWFPLTGRWLGFEDVRVLVDAASSTFVAQLLVPGPLVNKARIATFRGRYALANGFLCTAVVLDETTLPN